MNKKQLRRQYLLHRQSVSLPESHILVAAMLEHFQQIYLNEVQFLLSFKASLAKLEVPIHFFEEYLREENHHLSVCYPKADFVTNEMEAYEDNDKLTWEETTYNIDQPFHGDIILPQQLDCILVPLLAFDKKGYRVGYGKGFYDRYLHRCRKNAIKIGVSFFEAIDHISDTDQYDIPLNYCVTPQQLYVF